MEMRYHSWGVSLCSLKGNCPIILIERCERKMTDPMITLICPFKKKNANSFNIKWMFQFG